MRADTSKQKSVFSRGFTLVELAIAMFIFSLIISSILLPAVDVYEKLKNQEAREYLERASQAVVDYALRNRTAFRRIMHGGVASYIPAGRPYLPCPDTTGDGIENRIAINAAVEVVAAAPNPNQGACASDKGTIPWRTLQLQTEVDPWGNRLTYHVDSSYSNAVFGFDETTRADRHDTTRLVIAAGADAGFYEDKPTPARNRATFPFVVCGYPGAGVADCPENDDNIIAGYIIPNALARNAPYDYRGNYPNNIGRGVVFLVMSHGKNGRYARRQDGGCRGGNIALGAHEFRNGFRACGNALPGINERGGQNFYFSYPHIDDPNIGEFDDILRWTMADELMGALNDAGSTPEDEAAAKSPLPIIKLPFAP